MNRRLLLRASERLSKRAFTQMWNGCIDHDQSSALLAAWIAKEELCALLATARRGGIRHEVALFDAFRLEIRYDRATDTAHCRATLTTETLPAAVTAAGGDLATICYVPPTGFGPDGYGGSGGRLVVEASFRWRRP